MDRSKFSLPGLGLVGFVVLFLAAAPASGVQRTVLTEVWTIDT